MKALNMNTRKTYETPEIQITNMLNEGMFCESYGEDQGSWNNLSPMDIDANDPML